MSKIEEAKQILEALGLPKRQQNDRSALALLALCNIKENDKWSKAKAVSMSVVGNKENGKYEGVMRFVAQHYGKQYAENSRETFRRQTLHQFVQGGIVRGWDKITIPILDGWYNSIRHEIYEEIDLLHPVPFL